MRPPGESAAETGLPASSPARLSTPASAAPSPRAVWGVVGLAMVLPFLASLIYFVWFSDSIAARAVYGATKIFTLLWPWLAVRYLLRESWGMKGWKDARHLRALPLGMLTGLAIAGLMAALLQTPMRDVVWAGQEAIRRKTETMGVLEHYWLFAIAISVGHSLIEEYYWRWFVFGRLRQVVPLVAAHVLAGIAFASHHVVIASQYFGLGWGLLLGGLVGVGGVLWSWQYVRQRTLAGAWISHMIVDFALLTVGYLLLGGE